jgi:hypothetical protein
VIGECADLSAPDAGAGGHLGGSAVSVSLRGLIRLVRMTQHSRYTGEIVAWTCDGSPDCLRARLHSRGVWTGGEMTEHQNRWDSRIDSPGIALVLIVAVLAFVLASAALWIGLR